MAILGFFKYTDFAISNLNGLLGTAIPALGLLRPIGISCYTFQTMSYTIDVYRGLVPPQRNLSLIHIYFALYLHYGWQVASRIKISILGMSR